MAAKPKIHKFKLEDFREGAVCGVLCLAALREPSLLKPVQKWIDEGKLKFSPGESDIVSDVLWLADAMPKSEPETEPPKTKAKYNPTPPVRQELKQSWPYQCGQWARSEATKTGEKIDNPCTGDTGKRWQAGYDEKPEPALSPEACPCCERQEIGAGRATSGQVCQSCSYVLFPAKGEN